MRRFIALFLLLATVLSATACHKAAPMESFCLPESFDTSRQYEITFWAKHENNINQKNLYEQTVRDFEALYPNIKVHFQPYTDYSKIYDDVLTNIQTGTTPNVCITYPDHIATYLTGENTVVPLDNLFTDPRYGLGGSELAFDSPTKEQIIPQFLSECVVNGSFYAIPYMRSTEACYINKDMVEALGYEVPDILTWEFVWEVSEKAMAMGKDENGNFIANGQSTLIPFLYKSSDNMMIQYLRQTGGGYSTADGTVEIFNSTTDGFLAEIYTHAQSRAFSTFAISSYPANFLNAGQCIFAVDSTAGATWMGCEAPLIDISEDKLVTFETVVRPVPQADPENPQMISQGPSICIFNKEDPQEVLASWLFAQYLLTDQVQIAYSQTEGYIPVTSKAHENPIYQDYLSRRGEDNSLYYSVKLDTAKLLLENMENTFVTPVFNGSTDLRQCAGQMIEEITKGARRKKSLSSLMATLETDMTSLYHLDEIRPQGQSAVQKAPLGPMPTQSKVLLWSLGGIWLLLGAGFLTGLVKKRKKKS